MPVEPDRASFLRLAEDANVVPVTLEVLGDRDTPVSVYEKLVGTEPGFLLESVEGGETWARWSFVGWDHAFTLVAREGISTIEPGSADPAVGTPDGDPLQVLEAMLAGHRAADTGDLPPLHSGAVGYVAYDAVRYVERLPDRPPDDRELPELMLQFVGSLAAIDRFRQTIRLVRNVYVGDDPEGQYEEAVAALEQARRSLSRAGNSEVPAMPAFREIAPARANFTAEEFRDVVRRCLEHVAAGDAFQVVPSLRLELDFPGDPFSVYRALRLLNPSPYLFYVNHPDVTVVGASPELMVRVRGGQVFSRPIAGTRRRGATADEDAAREKELLADPKERAEHVMLVDLARNDLGRVSEYGTVQVDDLMVVERYSHVMHLVSAVSGRVRGDVTPVDVLRATFPHGTVSGAPKVRAMQIIDALEPQARGPYAGAVGYFDFSGNQETAIALRSLVVSNGRAWVQAGAGVVADSDPDTEYAECLSKATAVLAAVAEADHV